MSSEVPQVLLPALAAGCWLHSEAESCFIVSQSKTSRRVWSLPAPGGGGSWVYLWRGLAFGKEGPGLCFHCRLPAGLRQQLRSLPALQEPPPFPFLLPVLQM